jgi:hypothetical protein
MFIPSLVAYHSASVWRVCGSWVREASLVSSLILGRELFTIRTLSYEEDGWTYGDGNGAKLYEGWTDADLAPLLGQPLNYLRPAGSSAEIWHSDLLGLESGKSYGAWIRAWDMA